MDRNIFQGPVHSSRVYDLRFYVLGDEENLLDSNVHITNKEVMKGDIPAVEGIYDAHMGTTDHTWNCATCASNKNQCPGHYGSVDLKYPVKSPMFRDELLKWLKITCYYCGNLVVGIKKHVPDIKRLSEHVKNIRTVKKCPHCNRTHMQVGKDKYKPAVFYRILEDDRQRAQKLEFFNHEIEQVLDRIKDSTVEYMAKPLTSHPRKFILRTIRAPPNTIRPDIRRIGGARSSNSDTTSLLKTLVEINNQLPDKIPESSKIGQEIKDMYVTLDMTYFALVKGGGGGNIKLVTNTNKAPVALAERLPKKTGRVRGNLMGKRVGHIIRSVITGDSRLKIDEVGIPKMHATNLEIPETVSNKNIARLTMYYMNGVDRYPGCKRIIKKADGHTYRIEHMNSDYQLQEGDIVLRDMITGDVVAFNRQPSLLFSNIAGMKVVVMDVGNTLRINPSVCSYFNADFDGDQMNAAVGTGIQARNELMKISPVSRWFISPQNHSPLIGAFQDGLIGLAEITKGGLTLDKWHAMQFFRDIDFTKASFAKRQYTTRELVSMILPEINMLGKKPSFYRPEYAGLLKYNPDDISVNIIRGVLKSGILDKATSGQGQRGSIFHTIANEYGSHYAMNCVYQLQQLVHAFFMYHGFTVGVNDINISVDAMREVKRRIASMMLESRKITQRLNTGKLIAPLGTTLHEFYEAEQINSLTAGDDFVYPIFQDININNNGIARLILFGSKGKPPNFIALNGAIGLQTINGARFGPQAGWGRTSPYFVRHDTEPDANGYISASYREGVPSRVYSFMSGEARHGMISNALSTSVTGYQNRISIKNLETIQVDNLRKATKNMNIVQPLYAECGLNPAKTELVKFPTIMLSDEEFVKNYHTDITAVEKQFQTDEVRALLDEEFAQLSTDRDNFRHARLTLENHNPKEFIMEDKVQMPINIQRIIDDVLFNYEEMTRNMDTALLVLDPSYVIERVKKMCYTLGYVFLNEIQERLGRDIPRYLNQATEQVKILLRSFLNTSYLLRKKIKNHHLDIIIERAMLVYKRSLIEPGTAIGILAAQCISEPMTQFILDSKHRAGGQGGTQTNEIVRIQEILGAKDTKDMKNPHMLIMPRVEYESDKLKVQEIANHIEMMNFERFITSTHIFFEEYGRPVHPDFQHEAAVIKNIEKHNSGRKVPGDLVHWCIRYTLDQEQLILKSMKLETIIIAIKKQYPDMYLVYTPENSDSIFLRCYPRAIMFKKESKRYYEDNIAPLQEDIRKVIVRGIKDLISADVVTVIKTVRQKDGSLAREKVFGIATLGTNMPEVLTNPYIDPYRTQSDSVIEIERMFGIVAARNKIINELIATLGNLNKFHCTIFADEMTYSGNVTSIQKTGLQKREMANITLRLSFQTPVQVIQEAAVNGLVDRIGGISGPLIMGTNPLCGTTYNHFILNEDFIARNKKSLSEAIDDL